MAAAADGPGQWLIMWTRSRATWHVDGAVDGPDARAGGGYVAVTRVWKVSSHA